MRRSTTKDIDVDRWQLVDDVVRLRPQATTRGHALPTTPGKKWIIGSGASAWLRLEDSQGRISREHASLSHQDGKWILRDAGSTNGLLVQGQLHREVVLEPAMEIYIGGVTMIAESVRSIALHAFLGRLLGWGSDRALAVDLALRSIRVAALTTAALVLCGDDDIVSLARALHRHALGAQRPFVLCDPRRQRAAGTVRAVENYKKGMEALKVARGGSLCIWDKHPPRDFIDVKRALRNLDTRVTLIVCARQSSDAEILGVAPIVIPSLKRRIDELPRIVDEYARDAVAELGLERTDVPRAYRDWILSNEAGSLAHIEKATLRLLALREAGGNITRAAKRLGMGRWSLSKWIGRRRLPVAAESTDG